AYRWAQEYAPALSWMERFSLAAEKGEAKVYMTFLMAGLAGIFAGAFIFVTAATMTMLSALLVGAGMVMLSTGVILLLLAREGKVAEEEAEVAAPEERLDVAALQEKAAGSIRVKIQGRIQNVQVQFEEPETVTGEALSRFVTRKQKFTLRLDGRRLPGALVQAEGKTYLQLGDRWLSMEDTGHTVLPLQEIADTEFLLGNPGLRAFLGIKALTLEHLSKPMPKTLQLVTELPGVAETRYSKRDIRGALATLKKTRLLRLVEQERLTPGQYVHYLDALMILSNQHADHYAEHKYAMEQLLIFARVAPTLAATPLAPTHLALIPDLMVVMAKMKMGYPELLMDFLALPEARAQIKTKMDNQGTVITPEGEILEGDLANANYLETLTKKDLQEDFARRNVDLSLYRTMAEIGIAGQGSRILADYFHQNKIDANIFEVAPDKVAAFRKYLAKQGLPKDAVKKIGRYYFVNLMTLMAARNPEALWIGGQQTAASLENMLGQGRKLLTQTLVHYLNPDGTFQENAVDVGGHAFLLAAVLQDANSLADMIEQGLIWEHIQGDDLGNEFNSSAMAYLLRMGRTPFSPLVTPQDIQPVNRILEVQRALATGKTVLLGEQRVVSVRGQKVRLDDNSELDAAAIEADVRSRWNEVQDLITRAGAASGPAQLDLIIAAMQKFNETIEVPCQALEMQMGPLKMRLVDYTQNSGGHLISVAGGARFAEQSHYTQEVILTDSSGKSFTFPRNVFLAVMQRDFNTNHFSLDPIAMAANRDRRIKELYHAFLISAQTGQLNEAELLTARQDLEKAVAERIREIGNTEWTYRGYMLERLLLTVAPVPCEQKGKGENAYLKLNMMAQDAASFEAMLAESPVTADQITLAQLNAVLQAASSEESFGAKNAAKTKSLRQQGIQLAPVAELAALPRFIPIRVDVNDSTQAKNNFDQVVSRLNSVVGDYFVTEQTPLQRQASTGMAWAQWAGKHLLSQRAADAFTDLCEEIVDTSEAQLQTSGADKQQEFAKKVDFLHLIRKLIDAGNDAALYHWGQFLAQQPRGRMTLAQMQTALTEASDRLMAAEQQQALALEKA
ncbi:hypothetical protein JW933_01720, partial [candidate division FCPU426 bacterium]|nr:hypothetical protein [candidate division FCPU426 bacterium]